MPSSLILPLSQTTFSHLLLNPKTSPYLHSQNRILFPTSLRKHQKRIFPDSHHFRYPPTSTIPHKLSSPACCYHRWTIWMLYKACLGTCWWGLNPNWGHCSSNLPLFLPYYHFPSLYWIIFVNHKSMSTFLHVYILKTTITVPLLSPYWQQPHFFSFPCVARSLELSMFIDSNYFPSIPLEFTSIRFYSHYATEIAFVRVADDVHVVNYNGQTSDLDPSASYDALPLP